MQFMYKSLESGYEQVLAECKHKTLNMQDMCLRIVQEESEKAEHEMNRQTSQLKDEFKDKLRQLHEQ